MGMTSCDKRQKRRQEGRKNTLLMGIQKNAAMAWFSAFLIASVGFFVIFFRENYPDRIAAKIQEQMIQEIPEQAAPQDTIDATEYAPTDAECYLLKGWAESLKGFDADIVFIGDSITCGGNWAEWYPEYKVCNLSVPGNSIEMVNYRFEMVEGLHPQKVFVMVGINDVSREDYQQYMESRYIILLNHLRELNCQVYVQSILPVRAPEVVDNTRVVAANEMIKELAAEYSMTYVDVWSAFLDENQELKEEWTRDGCHLNEDGYAVWKEMLDCYITE